MASLRAKSVVQSALILAALFFAQLVSAAHIDFGDDVHPQGELCALCIVQAETGAANVGLRIVVDTDLRGAHEVEILVALSSWRRFEPHLARGPPQLS